MQSSQNTSTLPSSYLPANWRNTTPVHPKCNRIGIGFDLTDGENNTIVRLSLDLDNAKHLKESLENYLRSHSNKSNGIL